jgi:phosphonate transport system substrate-binding protein
MRSSFWFVLVLCAALAAPALAQKTIVIGRPAKEVKKEYVRLRPIADHLGARLGEYGIDAGTVLLDGKNSPQATLELFQNGEMDLIFETPYSSLFFMERGGAVPLCTITRDGAARYNTYIFARSDSGVAGLEDLRGKVVAFEDPGSTSAYFLPRRALENAGLKLAAMTDPEANPPADTVGYVFAGSELNVSSWVFFGRVDAGALSNLDWTDQEENPEAFRKQFSVIHETDEVPRMLVLARPDMDPALRRAARDILLAMPDTAEGRSALAPYDISGFQPIDDPDAFGRRLHRSLGDTRP